MLQRTPSSMSSFSSYDSFYSDRLPPPPIMAHASPSASSPMKARPTSFSGNNDMSGTLSRAHRKLALKAQKLSLASLGSELSNSCSALYSMLTDGGAVGHSSSTQAPTTLYYNSVRNLFHSNPTCKFACLSFLVFFKSCYSHTYFYYSQKMKRFFFQDQTDSVAAHTQKGIDFFEKYGNFVKERALIEEEYATKLRNLAKKNFGKRKDDDAKVFTYMSTFYTMLHELESLAGQHEVVADRLKNNIFKEVTSKCADLRQTRKNQLAHLTKLNMDLSKAVDQMEKYHRNYAKSFKEAEAAHVKHAKNDKNLDLSRAELEKSRNTVNCRNQACEEAKKNYANALIIANEAKVKHFEADLPNLLHQMKTSDIDRITHTQLAMQKTIEAETSVVKIIQACYDEMLRAVSAINPILDTQVVIDQNVSGYPVPDNYPFDDFGDPSRILNPDNADNVSMKRGTLPLSTKNGATKSIGRRQSMHQKFFGGNAEKPNKSNGENSDYGNLPPQQRCRKIQLKLEEFNKEKETLSNSLAGVEKMAEVYKGNPKLGNPKDVEPQIAEYRRHLSIINSDIAKFNVCLTF